MTDSCNKEDGRIGKRERKAGIGDGVFSAVKLHWIESGDQETVILATSRWDT